jgi:hypothetical protein
MGGYYKCTAESCKCRVKSTDGKLPRALTGWLTKSLHCCLNPKWSNPTGSFQLAQSASQFLEQAMLTQGSVKWVSETLYKNQNEYCKKKKAAYYTGEIEGAIFADFPLLKDRRGPFPPSSEQLLDLAEKDAKSKNTFLGVWCDEERHKHEIQGVRCNTLCVIDHTFSALSNYQLLLGAKAIFCQAVGGGQVSLVVLVNSTAINQASHAIEQCARCWNFRPFIISSDTFPMLFDFFNHHGPAWSLSLLTAHHQMHVQQPAPRLLATSSRPTKLPLSLQWPGQENGHSGSSR